jgi:regulator of protease activity HflC (stomatin/prohibitin superfamily)
MFILSVIVLLLAGAAVLAAVRFTAAARNAAASTGKSSRDDGREEQLRLRRMIATSVAGVLAALGLLFLFLSSFFTQDVGQANVLKDWTGNIVGQEATPGFHLKAPWVDTVTFDVRNQRVVYTGDSSTPSDNSGGQADGAQITVQDQEGVTANVDIAIRYSIKPDAVIDIYSQYLNEDNLKTRLIFNDVRSVVRSVPGQFTTLQLLTERDDVQQAIFDALEDRWADDGIIVEDVALQEIRYGEAVTNAFAEAQQAQIGVTTEQAKLEAAKVSAQQKVVQAQAESDANALLNASLTEAILRQRYLDTLAKLAEGGNLVITDGTGSQVLIQR